MITLTLALWQMPTPDVELMGLATYYAEGIMHQVSDYRGMDLAGYVGGVALNRAEDSAGRCGGWLGRHCRRAVPRGGL